MYTIIYNVFRGWYSREKGQNQPLAELILTVV